jgi:hypothetical protein
MPLDDRPIGQVLSRRQVLALLGAGRVSLLTGASPAWAQGAPGATGCVVRPAQTEGPYVVDERLQRSDLRTDPTDGRVRLGIPLELTLVISRLAGTACAPLAGAQVDVWHGDHLGVYSDVTDPRFTTTPRARRAYAALNAPMRRARPASRRSTRVGTRAGRSPSTSRSAHPRDHARGMRSPPSSTSMTD